MCATIDVFWNEHLRRKAEELFLMRKNIIDYGQQGSQEFATKGQCTPHQFQQPFTLVSDYLLCLLVCVWGGEKGRGGERDRVCVCVRERERGRESMCVSLYVSVYVRCCQRCVFNRAFKWFVVSTYFVCVLVIFCMLVLFVVVVFPQRHYQITF